jgi:tetratricopeptide (TPR) repeat protein
MVRNLIFIFLLLLVSLSFGQRVLQRIEVGDQLFESEQYEEAIEVYQKILKKEDDSGIRNRLAFKVGDAYRELLNYEEAKKWYQIALNLGYSDYDVYLYLSEMTLGLEEFDSTIDYVNTYLEKFPDDKLANKLLESAKFARDNYFTETIFETSNEGGINNPGQQWGVSFLENVAVTYEDQEKVEEQVYRR